MGLYATISLVHVLSNDPIYCLTFDGNLHLWYMYSVMILYVVLLLMEIYTYDHWQMETCDIMNKDFAIFKKLKTTQEANTETKTKYMYVVPKLGIKNTPGPNIGLKKKAARNPTSFHHHPKRSLAKSVSRKLKKLPNQK